MLLRNWLKRFGRKFVPGQSRRKPPQTVLEHLESRTLMSVTPAALTFTATEAAAFSGTVATFTSGDANPQSASNYSATIDWGGGSQTAGTITPTATGFEVVGGHTFTEDGNQNVNVTINDSIDGTHRTAHSHAEVAEQPLELTTNPIAAMEGTAFSGTLGTFTDPGTSGDPDEYVAVVDWGDGHTSRATLSHVSGADFNLNGSHTYSDEGNYTATATIWEEDAAGTRVSATFNVAVADSDNFADTRMKVHATEGQTFSGVVSVMLPTNPDADPDDFNVNIKWGDGQMSAGVITVNNGWWEISGNHQYADEGIYRIVTSLSEKGINGPCFTSRTVAFVSDADVLAGTGMTLAATEGSVFGGPVATFSNTGYAGNPSSDFTATIDWGDGTTNTGTVSGGAGSFTISGSHAYQDEGTYTPVVTLNDDAPGTASATTSSTMVVADADLLSGTGIMTLAATEGSAFAGPVAIFTNAGYAGNPSSDFTATIDWGDGNTGAGTISGSAGNFTITGSHTYQDEGTYTPVVTLSDDAPGTASATASSFMTVADADLLNGTGMTLAATEGAAFSGPVATFSNTGYAGNPSSDFTATIDWGDGNTGAGTISGSGGNFTITGSHTYQDEGTYTPVVTLSDDAPGTASATASSFMTVADADVISGTGITTLAATEGSAFSGAVATFTNTGYAGNPAADFSATIDWGDGTLDTGTVSGKGGDFTVTGNHTYQDEGTYAPIVTLSDDALGSASATASSSIVVADVDVLSGTGITTLAATEGSAFSGAVATFTNTSYAGNPSSDFTATIDWGDGTTNTGTVSGGAGSFTISGSHAYQDEGTYTPVVTLNDDAPGTASATASSFMTVADADLVNGNGMTLAATEGAAFSGPVATFSNTGYAGNPSSDFTATIDWGDGSTGAGTISGSAGNFTITGSHTYQDEGTYTPVVTLGDDAPGTVSATAFSSMIVADADVLNGSGMTLAATEGSAFSGAVATFSNPGYAGNPSSDFTATIDWGDGTTGAGTVSGKGGDFTVSGSHTYQDEGTYAPIVTLSDDAPGSANATASSSMIVADADVLSGTGITTLAATEGTEFSGAVATFTNTGYAGNPAADFSGTIDWGDGSTGAGTISGSAGNFTITGSHTYQDEGTYTPVVTLSDDAPGTASATASSFMTVTDGDLLSGSGMTLAATEGSLFSGPVATFSNTGYAGNPSSDFTATIDWGDGSTGAGAISGSAGNFTITGSHTYQDEGTYTPVVTLGDDAPGTVSATAFSSMIVADADVLNGSGMTLAATEGSAFSGAVATFSNSGYAGNPSSDFTATIDWGDGTTDIGTISGGGGSFTISGSHTYAEDGSYTIATSIVEDAAGTATATATGSANVAEADLALSPAAALSFKEGATFSGVIATIADPGSTDPASSFSATIDWGDGATSSGTITGSAGDYTVAGSHAYADEGAYSVTVTATENSAAPAASATATFTATVAEGDFGTLAATTIAPTEGQAFSGAVGSFTDEGNPLQVAGDFTASIDWGDGTTTAGTVTGSTGGPFTINGRHTYAGEGTYTVLASFADDAPSSLAATITSTAAVSDADVLSASGAALTATEGATFSGTVASFTSANVNSPAADFSAVIQWGDGTSSSGTVSGSAGSFTIAGSHVFSDEGSLITSIQVSENAPGSETATAAGSVSVVEGDTFSLTASPLTATQGAAFSGQVATFTDANPDTSIADITAAIDWGDGTISAGTITDSSGTFVVSGTHTYQTIAAAPMEVTVGENAPGTATAKSQAPVVIDSITILSNPIVGTGASLNGYEFTPLNNVAVATFTHAGSDPASDFTATINWGDGTTSTGTVALSAGVYTVTGSHNYTDEHVYAVTVAVQDSADSSSQTLNAGATMLEELLPGGVRGTANERFVGEVYRDVLGRAVDTTSLASLNGELNAGMSRVTVAGQILASADAGELRGQIIQNAFQKFLHRSAENAALSFYGNLLATGTTVEQLDAMIISSNEYYAVRGGGTADGFANAVYEDLLGRPIDASAKIAVEQFLARGGARILVIDEVMLSAEYDHIFIENAFTTYLHRPADSGALSGLGGQLAAGVSQNQVTAEILGSNEYFAQVSS